MGAGEFFGEIRLLATGTQTATVRAVSEVRVLSTTSPCQRGDLPQ
jgi:CRP-like cAMP-binding protein